MGVIGLEWPNSLGAGPAVQRNQDAGFLDGDPYWKPPTN